MQGWISLHRGITKNWLWEDKPFSKGQAWIDLLLMMNHKDNKVLFRDELLSVKRGQRITSQVKLSERWGWSRGKVRKFLKMLENDEMLYIETDKRKTVITVVNYNSYQDNVNTKSQQTEQQKDKRKPTESQEADTNNKDNKDNKDNNDNNKDLSVNKKKKFDPRNDDYTDEFLKAYNLYPKPGGKRQGMINFYKLLKKHSYDELITSIKNYKEYSNMLETKRKYLIKFSNFFGEKASYEDYLEGEYIKPKKSSNKNAFHEMQTGKDYTEDELMKQLGIKS